MIALGRFCGLAICINITAGKSQNLEMHKDGSPFNENSDVLPQISSKSSATCTPQLFLSLYAPCQATR